MGRGENYEGRKNKEPLEGRPVGDISSAQKSS